VLAILLSLAAPETDIHALELLASAAGNSLECRNADPPATLIGIAPAAAPGPLASPPKTSQEWHARALRFARVRVAEIRLYQAEQVLAGRASRDLYALLRPEIDQGRQEFREAFLSVPSMTDYFHQEILHTLAHDDDTLLGPAYPGPLA
jgi:hypothetical protein